MRERNPAPHPDPAAPAALERLERLVSPLGVAGRLERLAVPAGLRRLSGTGCTIGVGTADGDLVAAAQRSPVLCGGRAVDDAGHARLLAIAEGAERYSSGGFTAEPSVFARREDLDGALLDPASVPRCSERELAHPSCPLRPYDPRVPIHWVRGVDLHRASEAWIPAAMAYFGTRGRQRTEAFWYRISTGYAVHFDPYEALLSAMCEVVERDIVMISWLQRMPLPPLAQDGLSEAACHLVDWARDRYIRTRLFDATTDLGVPTVVCVQSAEHDPRARTIMSAGTGRDLAAAAEKALLEVVFGRNTHHRGDVVPERVEDFRALSDSAHYMALPAHAAAFEFLLCDTGGHGRRREARAPVEPLPQDPRAAVTTVLDRLRARGMRAYAVDRTRGELAEIGLHAFTVVLPELQPMTTRPFCQYRANPRLYTLPERLGYVSHPEQELNPWPVPFA